jgi:arylsulfatase A-like enzyme
LGNRSTRLLVTVLIVTAGVCAVVALYGCSQDRPVRVEPRRPNILLVLFDTLRADRTEPYGAKGVATPALARLSSRGVTFLDTHANASWTAPSVASMLSGVYPSVHGITGTGWIESLESTVSALHEDIAYLPEILEQNGYATAAIVKNPFIHSAFGFGRGFDQVHTLYKQRRAIREEYPTPEGQADAVWDQFISPLAEGEGTSPFFVYLHELDPHHPYDPLPPYDTLYPAPWGGDKELLRTRSFAFVYRRKPQVLAGGGRAYVNSQYNGEVTFMDAYLGRLLERLDASGHSEDTLVVFVSDHGESLTEHQIIGHGLRLYEELLQVPFILSHPTVLPAGLKIETPVELVDLPKTLLELVDIEAPEGMQGRSLVPLIEGRDPDAERATYAQALFGSLYSYDSVRLGRWKLIRENPLGGSAGKGAGKGKEPSRKSPRYELYDLVEDPGELRNLWSKDNPIARDLQARLEARHRDDAPRLEAHRSSTRVMDAEMRENLQALGYLE